jgi:phosphoserine aminotransferase
MDIDWQKIDILTYSFQKAMGGEAAHGVLVLSPKAVKRIESNPPVRAIPRLFKILKNGKVDVSIFEGSTINTPSMLCIEDAIDSIEWIESIGGVKECIKQSNEKLSLVKHWIKSGAKFAFLNDDESTISNTSVCLKIHSPLYNLLPEDKKSEFAKEIIKILEKEGAAYDAGAYRDAPPGVRIWCGATVVKKDVENLLPWLDYAYEVVSKKFS